MMLLITNLHIATLAMKCSFVVRSCTNSIKHGLSYRYDQVYMQSKSRSKYVIIDIRTIHFFEFAV